MTRPVDSGALTLVNRILKIAGSGFGAAQTDLDDGHLDQVLNVNEIVRRSRTTGRDGLFYSVQLNAHAGADAELSFVNPYAAIGSRNGWPAIVPNHLEVWLLEASLRETGVGGGLTDAVLLMQGPAVAQGFGQNDGAVAVVITMNHILARWDSLVIANTDVGPYGITADGDPVQRINMRMPRDTSVQFITESAAAATFECTCIWGLFPIALGQDVKA